MRAKNWLPLNRLIDKAQQPPNYSSTPRQWMVSGYVKQPHPARSQVDVNINLKIKHD